MAFDWEFIGVTLLVLGTAVGWVLTKRQKSIISTYMSRIDDEYTSYKRKPKQCEAELYNLRHQISDELKKGKLDAQSYSILDKRIDDYLSEIREKLIEDKFGGIPHELKDKLMASLADGDISAHDLKTLQRIIGKTTMSKSEKDQLKDVIKEWKESDKESVAVSEAVKAKKIGSIQVSYCPNCGRKAKPEEKKCLGCGYQLKDKGILGKTLGKVPLNNNRISIISFIWGAIATLLGIGLLGAKNGGFIIFLPLGIATIISAYRLRKGKGLLLSKTVYAVFLTLGLLLLATPAAVIGLVFILTGAAILYRLFAGE